MTRLTFSQAKNISADVWDYARKHGNKPSSKKLYKIVKRRAPRFDGLDHKKKYVDLAFGCGFCEHYECICRECPLFWEDCYECGTLPCSRNFWNWSHCIANDDIIGAKEWAEKMYQEVLDA